MVLIDWYALLTYLLCEIIMYICILILMSKPTSIIFCLPNITLAIYMRAIVLLLTCFNIISVKRWIDILIICRCCHTGKNTFIHAMYYTFISLYSIFYILTLYIRSRVYWSLVFQAEITFYLTWNFDESRQKLGND